MLEALCRQSSTTLDIVHGEDGPPITQRTSGLVACGGEVDSGRRAHRADRACADHRQPRSMAAFCQHGVARLVLETVDPMVALADFDPQYIHDGVLGGPGR